jgi:hypothetical protein
MERKGLRRNRVKKTPFQLKEDPNDKRKYFSSSTSSTVPPKKAQPPKLKAPPAKVLTKVYDIGNGRDIHEYCDNTIEYFQW